MSKNVKTFKLGQAKKTKVLLNFILDLFYIQ